MSKYIETVVGNENQIRIEVSDDENIIVNGGNVVKASPSMQELTDRMEIAFQQILNVTHSLADEFGQQIQKIESLPDEIELTFGVKIDASADIFIARAGGEAQFLVKIIWKNKNK